MAWAGRVIPPFSTGYAVEFMRPFSVSVHGHCTANSCASSPHERAYRSPCRVACTLPARARSPEGRSRIIILSSPAMLKDFSLQSAAMGVLIAFVGFASSFAVVLQGLKGVGASDYQAASGLMALAISMGLCGIVLSVWTKMPVSAAWSTPGAALMVTAGAPVGGFPAAVGAFIVCAGLIVLAGLFRPFGRAVASIPSPLANAMLGG
eukprot:gene64198-87818_t